MKSPFPGMDPYLEESWGDVHTRIALYGCDQLKRQLPRDLVARVEEHVSLDIEDDDGTHRGFYRDVRVEEFPNGNGSLPEEGSSAIAVAESIRVKSAVPRTQRSIQIIAPRSGNRVITVIEILSPGNKIGEKSRSIYRTNRDQLLEANASVVEIDLVRAGRPLLPVTLTSLPLKYRGPYRVAVTRAWDGDETQIYRLPLRRKLPTVQIPSRENDAEAGLDLQALIDLAYENGSYDRTDYRRDLNPPLSPEDAKWLDELLRSKGLR